MDAPDSCPSCDRHISPYHEKTCDNCEEQTCGLCLRYTQLSHGFDGWHCKRCRREDESYSIKETRHGHLD